MQCKGGEQQALGQAAQHHQAFHHQRERHQQLSRRQTGPDQTQSTAREPHSEQGDHPAAGALQTHQGEGHQKQQVIGAEQGVGQTADQTGEGTGHQLHALHRMVSQGRPCHQKSQGAGNRHEAVKHV